MSVEFFVNY